MKKEVVEDEERGGSRPNLGPHKEFVGLTIKGEVKNEVPLRLDDVRGSSTWVKDCDNHDWN